MRGVTEVVCRRTNHWMAKVVNNKHGATIFCLWNKNTVVLLEHTLFKHKVSAARWHHSLSNIRFVHLPDLISMSARAIDHHFCLDSKLFLLRIKLINTHASDDLAILIFDETLENDIVG